MSRSCPQTTRSRLFAVLALAGSVAAEAEIVSAGPGGFVVASEAVIAVDRGRAWQAAVDDVGLWWSDDLTVSGDAARLSIDARPMGCFCEMLGDDDGIAHLVVTTASRAVMLRMTGGLGPLGLMGVNGNMTWEFFDADDAGLTEVRFTYAVGGYAPDGLDTLAEPVDRVIGDALGRLKVHLEANRDDD